MLVPRTVVGVSYAARARGMSPMPKPNCLWTTTTHLSPIVPVGRASFFTTTARRAAQDQHNSKDESVPESKSYAPKNPVDPATSASQATKSPPTPVRATDSSLNQIRSALRKPREAATAAAQRTRQATIALQERAAASRARAHRAWQHAQAHPVLGPVLRLIIRLWARLASAIRSVFRAVFARVASRPAAQHTQLELAAEKQVAGKLTAAFGSDRNRAVAALALALTASAAVLVLPWAAGGLVDGYGAKLSESATDSAAHPTTPKAGGVWAGLSLFTLGSVLLGLFAARAGGQAGGTLLFQLASIRTTARLRTALADKLLAADVPWAQAHGRALAQAANKDLATLTTALQGSVLPLVGEGAVATGSSIALISSAPVLVLLLAVMVPALSRATYVYERFLTNQADDVSALRQSVGAALEHALPPSASTEIITEPTQKEKDQTDAATYLTMKRLGKEPEVSASLARHVDALSHAERTQAQAWGFYTGGAGLLGNGVALALLGYGGLLVARGSLTPGELVSLALYTGLLGKSLPPARAAYIQTADGLAAAKRVFDLLEPRLPSAGLDAPAASLSAQPPGPRPSVQFKQVSTTPGSTPVLHKADLVIPGGQNAVFLAPPAHEELQPGMGSSIFDLVQGVATAREGQVTVDDALRTASSLRKAFVSVEAVPSFAPDQTISEAIASGAEAGSRTPTPEELEQAVQWAQCDSFRSSPGLDTNVSELNTTSARWRVGLARALVRAQVQANSTSTSVAPVLLLDVRAVERAASLSTQGDQGAYLAVQAVLTAQRSLNTPVWIVSSTTAWPQLQPHVVVLFAQGQVVQSGSLDAVNVPGSAYQTMLAHAQAHLPPPGAIAHPESDSQHRIDLAGLGRAVGSIPRAPQPPKPLGGQQTVAFHSSTRRSENDDPLTGHLESWSVAQETSSTRRTLASSELEQLHLASHLAPPSWPTAPPAPEGLDEMIAMFDSVRARDQAVKQDTAQKS